MKKTFRTLALLLLIAGTGDRCSRTLDKHPKPTPGTAAANCRVVSGKQACN